MKDTDLEQQLLLEEWKETRNTIGRFDEYIVSLRKFGFTLTTLLLTTDSYLSIVGAMRTNPYAMTGSTIFLLILILALFLLDQHIHALLLAATERSIQIEEKSSILRLTHLLKSMHRKPSTNWGTTPVYVIFVVATGILGIVTLFLYQPVEGDIIQPFTPIVMKGFVGGFCFIISLFMPIYSRMTRKAAESLG